MSRDSKHGKDNPRRRRNDGEPSWYDKAVYTDYQEDVMPIPKGKVALIIGKKGWRIKDIKEQTGVKELIIRDDQVHIRGSEEQCSKAKKIIAMILEGEDSPDQGSWKKLDFIPEIYMGKVIGRNREHLNYIEQKTGATLKVYRKGSNSSLYIKGSIESQKRAIREINETVDEKDDFIGMEILRDKLLMVLQNVQKEKEEERVTVDIWCHFGHTYITKVDEADREEEYFTLEEIKEKLEDQRLGWKSKFKGGLEKIEVEHIEEGLESRAANEEVRYDYTFYTPTCRYVRVKAWLSEEDGGEQEGDEATSMAFSRSAPFSVMSVMSHALPDEQGDSPHTPCFYMCSQTQQRLKADIVMPSKECDCRLFVKTCPVIGLVPRTPQAEEEDKILESYLMGMKIKDGQLMLPPVAERPDGFDLFYQRRSRRRIYEYEIDDEKFTLLISKYQEKTVDAAETEASDFDEMDTETDIHLHCKEWDRMLQEEHWEPEQIVAKLPIFLQFLRTVQRSVAP